MSAFQAALTLADELIPVFPCNSEKEPICDNGFYDATLNPTVKFWRGGPLVGMPTGARSGWDVLDLDWGKGGEAWWEANKHRLPATRVLHTRSGGRHLYFRTAPGLRCSESKIAPGVDVRANGGYAVVWRAAGLPWEDVPVVEWPDWLLDLARGSTASKDAAAGGDHTDLAAPSVAAVVDLLERMDNPEAAGRGVYVRVMLAAVGATRGLAAVGIEDDEGLIREAALAWASKWEGGSDEAAEADKWDTDWATRTTPLAGWPTLQALAGQFLPGYRAEVAAAEFGAVPLPPDTSGPDAWRARLRASDKGVPYGDLANVLIALRCAPAWSGVLALNTFASRVELHAPPPWHRGEWKPRALQDTDARHAAEWMQLAGLRVDVKTVSDGLMTAADAGAYHPVRRYLDGLVWDGQGRIDAWLHDHLGAEDNPLNRAFASRFLIGAVARTMRPGCKLDTALMLEGDQNLGKSSALAALCNEREWFNDHISDLGSKDARQELQGKLITEFAEMDNVSRADVAKVKAFLSTAVDHFRGSYAMYARDYPRCGVFAGTINPESAGYLKDNTGNRRFWTVACGVGWMPGREVDQVALAAARDQLWAEAVVRFKAGQPWWLAERALQVAQAGAAELRRETDAWEEPILAFVHDRENVSTGDILTLCLGKPVGAHTKPDAMKVAGILRAASWTRRKVRVGHQTCWRFYPPTPPVRSSAVVVPMRPGDEFARLVG